MDMAEVLLWVANRSPAIMESTRSEEFMTVVIVFLGSTEYIKNPFLRSKLVEVSRSAHLAKDEYRA